MYDYYIIYCVLVQLFFANLHKILRRGAIKMKNDKSIDRIIQINDIKIGQNIARLRKASGMKQTEMVARLQVTGIDISVYSYNRIEKGTQNPTVSFLYACCEIFSCDMNVLFAFNTFHSGSNFSQDTSLFARIVENVRH